MGITTALLGLAAAASVGAGVKQANQQKKAAKAQARQVEAEAKEAARQAAAEAQNAQALDAAQAAAAQAQTQEDTAPVSIKQADTRSTRAKRSQFKTGGAAAAPSISI